MLDSECGGNNNQEEYTKENRAWLLIDRIKQYNDLARVTKDIRNYLRDRAVVWWRMGDDDVEEWQEEKGDQFIDFMEFYEKPQRL